MSEVTGRQIQHPNLPWNFITHGFLEPFERLAWRCLQIRAGEKCFLSVGESGSKNVDKGPVNNLWTAELSSLTARPPLSRYRVSLYLSHLCFSGIAGYRAIPPPPPNLGRTP